MSMGYAARCRIKNENEAEVVYEYACYNLNNDDYELAKESFCGLITIKKNAFVEPEIHEKIKRFPNGKKELIIKRVKREVDYETLFDTGQITIKNSTYCWKTISGFDIMALKLIWKIFSIYQDNSLIPKSIAIDY